jgi:hypothetical protein
MPRKSAEVLEQEIARLTDENNILREAVKEFRGLMETRPAAEREDGLMGLLKYAWGLPGFRVMLLVSILILWMALYSPEKNLWLNNTFCGCTALFFFCKWSQAEYKNKGFVQLLMKWVLFGTGVYLMAVLFFWGCDWWFAGGGLAVFGLLTISKLTVTIAKNIREMGEEAMEIEFVSRVMGWLI